jgi:hypothetical protein
MDMLENLQNYGYYVDLVKTGRIRVNANQISIHNWRDHYQSILNILKDGIETDWVQNMCITVDYGNGEDIDLYITDYYINLLFWYLPLSLEDTVLTPKYLFFEEKMTGRAIKEYVDKLFIIPHRGIVDNKILNNVISDFLYNFIDIDQFSMFLANTLNLEDTIELMNASPEYDAIIHADLSTEPLENVKNKGMEYVAQAQKLIYDAENIMGHEHCLRNPFVSGEGINKKQYKENSINIGTKSDGQGSIYHTIINQSYITGGLNKLIYQFIDSASARVAQIISKKNVGDSGGFARILGLNNVDTFLHQDPTFDCGTTNYITQFIPNKNVFEMLMGRYYKLNEHGQLLKITEADTHLIGKTILLRSPIHCASLAAGNGICYHCYGDLAHTNHDISVGRIATEIITAQYTQMRLSAKHLLETKIKPIHWVDEFYDWFTLDINGIQVRHDIDTASLNGWKLSISLNSIQLENDDDFYKHEYYSDGMNSTIDDGPFYNEYVTEFNVVSPDGSKIIPITSHIEEEDDEEEKVPSKLYITDQFGAIIRKNISIDDESDDIEISLNELIDTNIFIIKMENNELGSALDTFVDLINKRDVTKKLNASELVQALQLNVLKGNIHCASIHLEVIVANQIRSANDRLLMPNWYCKNEPYELLTLNEALKDSRSPIISLTYSKLADTLKYPLTFKKCGSSIFDLFYIRKPLKFIHATHDILDVNDKRAVHPGDSPVVFAHDHSGEHPKNRLQYVEPFRTRPKDRLDD